MSSQIQLAAINLGDEEAARDDRLLTGSCFVETHAYKQAHRQDRNFFIGRKGSGKTAMALRLVQDASGCYKHVVQITNEDAYRVLANAMKEELLPHETDRFETELNSFFREAWLFGLLVRIMLEVAPDTQLARGALARVSDFLTSHRLRDTRGTIRRLIDAARKAIDALPAFTANPDLDEYMKITEVVDELQSAEFGEATECLLAYLAQANERVLVVIDTISDHYVDNAVFAGMMGGLLKAVYELTLPKYSRCMDIKCFVPNEVCQRIHLRDWDKIEGRSARISWADNTLLFELIARRVHAAIVASGQRDNSMDLLEAFELVFPTRIRNRQGYEEATVDYIVRHTQSRPRDVLRLAKAIIEQGASKGRGVVDDHIITRVIHTTCGSFLPGLTDAYHDVYPGADKWIETLRGHSNVVTTEGLSGHLKRARQHFPDGESPRDIIGHLVDMGIIGIVVHTGVLGEAQLYVTEFQYNRQEELAILGDETFAVHPMCYERLSMKPVSGVIVQPKVERMARNVVGSVAAVEKPAS